MRSLRFAALAALPLAISAQEVSSETPISIYVYTPASGTGFTTTDEPLPPTATTVADTEDPDVQAVTGVHRIGTNYTSTYTDEGYYATETEGPKVRTVTGVRRYGLNYTSTYTDEGHYAASSAASGIVGGGVTEILTNPIRVTGSQTAGVDASPSPWYNPILPYGPDNGTTARTSVGPAITGIVAPSSTGPAVPEAFEGGSAKTGIAGGVMALVAGLAAGLAL